MDVISAVSRREDKTWTKWGMSSAVSPREGKTWTNWGDPSIQVWEVRLCSGKLTLLTHAYNQFPRIYTATSPASKEMSSSGELVPRLYRSQNKQYEPCGPIWSHLINNNSFQ